MFPCSSRKSAGLHDAEKCRRHQDDDKGTTIIGVIAATEEGVENPRALANNNRYPRRWWYLGDVAELQRMNDVNHTMCNMQITIQLSSK